MNQTSEQDLALAKELKVVYAELTKEISKVIVGQQEVVQQVLISIFCNSHSLLVGVPGLAKTLLVKTISSVLDLQFNRVQFTPDLMPSDIVGAETLNINREIQFVKGPIFANIVLADEINRTPPKTQSALLEAMQEKNVTIGGKLWELPSPFFVLATQNPIEQEGTYPLPEAQLDRFMFNIMVGYPSYEEELAIVKNTTSDYKPTLKPILNAAKILAYRELIKKIPVSEAVMEYSVSLVHKTRATSSFATAVTKEFIEWGAGPRASQHLINGAKCYALLNGKLSPDIEDVKAVAVPILRHRILPNFKAEAEGLAADELVRRLL